MPQSRIRNFLAAVSMALTLFDAGVAFAMPVGPMPDSGALSATLARGGRGGGGRGFHGGGGRGFHGGGRAVAVRGGHRGGAVAVRGGAYRGRAVAVRGGGVHRGAVVRGGAVRGGRAVVWGRPAYRWPAGGAIAAGAAIGFVTAGAAAAYVASRPPAPGLCWYYTDASRRSGFWDNCP